MSSSSMVAMYVCKVTGSIIGVDKTPSAKLSRAVKKASKVTAYCL